MKKESKRKKRQRLAKMKSAYEALPVETWHLRIGNVEIPIPPPVITSHHG